MCGIAGFWSNSSVELEVASRMAAQISTRGPDDMGVWGDASCGIALAHRRLSILDLSKAGHQPMQTPCGRYTLVYNGEIYNHRELRQELERKLGEIEWRGHSDTETLLVALANFGVPETLEKLNGMFAFALWDASTQRLYMARDRIGEKPLYYGFTGKAFLFGSELKALKPHPGWQADIDRNALALYMRHNYVPAPWSIYTGIKKLLPAHYVVVSNEGRNVSEPIRYWNLGALAEQGIKVKCNNSEGLVSELDTLLRDAVLRRMDSDVPLGAFLSGGYDSTIVTALMQVQSDRPVQTFTIGFDEEGYNEAVHAKAVAGHLGTDHTEMYVTSTDALSVIPELPTIYDEPFADSSQIPTYLVSKLARSQVTVSLSGDGGDELFCGYSRYALGYRIWSKLRLIPPSVRSLLAKGINVAPLSAIDQLQQYLPKSLQVRDLPDRLPKLAEVLSHREGFDFYRDLVSHSKSPEDIVLRSSEPLTLLNSAEKMPALHDFREYMMYLDTMTYLPDDILTKVDRASMAVSLEARVPLIDHRVVEFAWRVPTQYKYRDGKSKWLLRKVLDRYVPAELMDRPKMGFGVPIEHWLRNELREWAEDLLSEQRLHQEGYFNPGPVRKMWEEHVNGDRRWHSQLWNVLMFQAWLEENPP